MRLPTRSRNAEVVAALSDDLNTPSAMSIIHGVAKSAAAQREGGGADSRRRCSSSVSIENEKPRLISPSGTKRRNVDAEQVGNLIDARNAARKARNFKEADRIRDELSAMGIQLKDAKDPRPARS